MGTPLLSDHAASDMDISHAEGDAVRHGLGSAASTDKSPTETAANDVPPPLSPALSPAYLVCAV